jgi:hypothetical protein
MNQPACLSAYEKSPSVEHKHIRRVVCQVWGDLNKVVSASAVGTSVFVTSVTTSLVNR